LQGVGICKKLINDGKQNTEKYQPQYPSKENILGEIFEETDNEKFFTPSKSPQKSEENRHVRDNGESITSMFECAHSNAIKDLIE
jgi:hypothetical protein